MYMLLNFTLLITGPKILSGMWVLKEDSTIWICLACSLNFSQKAALARDNFVFTDDGVQIKGHNIFLCTEKNLL